MSKADLVQQGDAGGVVVRGRGEHYHHDHQTENLNCQTGLAAWDLIVLSGGAGGHPGGRVQALGVEQHLGCFCPVVAVCCSRGP